MNSIQIFALETSILTGYLLGVVASNHDISNVKADKMRKFCRWMKNSANLEQGEVQRGDVWSKAYHFLESLTHPPRSNVLTYLQCKADLV